jgi:hypothetical protein
MLSSLLSWGVADQDAEFASDAVGLRLHHPSPPVRTATCSPLRLSNRGCIEWVRVGLQEGEKVDVESIGLR